VKDPRTDEIAFEAARLINTGRVDSVHQAIRLAAETCTIQGVPMPSALRVRKHAQAMSMQALGEAAYNLTRTRMWNVAEELLSTLEHAVPASACFIMGRAAQGHCDAGVVIHLRIYTRHAIGEIARALVEFGYNEPSFETADTLRGKFDQIRLIEDQFECVVTRCTPESAVPHDVDLFSGKHIEALALSELRKRIEGSEARGEELD
jgi:hypothetical protein